MLWPSSLASRKNAEWHLLRHLYETNEHKQQNKINELVVNSEVTLLCSASVFSLFRSQSGQPVPCFLESSKHRIEMLSVLSTPLTSDKDIISSVCCSFVIALFCLHYDEDIACLMWKVSIDAVEWYRQVKCCQFIDEIMTFTTLLQFLSLPFTVEILMPV